MPCGYKPHLPGLGVKNQSKNGKLNNPAYNRVVQCEISNSSLNTTARIITAGRRNRTCRQSKTPSRKVWQNSPKPRYRSSGQGGRIPVSTQKDRSPTSIQIHRYPSSRFRKDSTPFCLGISLSVPQQRCPLSFMPVSVQRVGGTDTRSLNRGYPSALLRQTSYCFPTEIDLSRTNDLCQTLVGKHDFSSFQKVGSDRINPVCEIYEAHWWKQEPYVYFEIEADAFLRGMVRAITGTLLAINSKFWKPTNYAKNTKYPDADTQIRCILEAKDRAAAGMSVPAHGLSLIEVKYNA